MTWGTAWADEALEIEREADARAKATTYRCGGWASADGPCGADDCDDCHPGGNDDDES